MTYLNFLKNYLTFKIASGRLVKRFNVLWSDRYPCLLDDTVTTGFDRHYVYHTAWAARIIAFLKPPFHIDISSSLYFSAILSAHVPVRFYDYRPAELGLDGLIAVRADLLSLPFEDNSISTLSCMHVVEHIGLGRYGDPIDPNGDLKAIAEMRRVLVPGGNLLFVVPVGGVPKIMFNAHRIYSYQQIVDYFAGFKLKEFALVPDDPQDGGIIRNAAQEIADSQTYGCGCFWFEK